MEKIEIKHVAPYLPYKLQYKVGVVSIATMTGQDTSSNQIAIDYAITNPAWKPILKPLSKLTEDKKFIDFIDSELICGTWKFDEDIIPDTKEVLRVIIRTLPESVIPLHDTIEISAELPYLIVLWLLENHYDINGLIPKDLAIDINTLKQ